MDAITNNLALKLTKGSKKTILLFRLYSFSGGAINWPKKVLGKLRIG